MSHVHVYQVLVLQWPLGFSVHGHLWLTGVHVSSLYPPSNYLVHVWSGVHALIGAVEYVLSFPVSVHLVVVG